MSKSSSGYFKGTTGCNKAYKNFSQESNRSAIITSKGLDLVNTPQNINN